MSRHVRVSHLLMSSFYAKVLRSYQHLYNFVIRIFKNNPLQLLNNRNGNEWAQRQETGFV